MSEQDYDIFIGREKEIALFEQMLDTTESPAWILNIHGRGGIGKTYLLRRFIEIAAQRHNILITSDLIDLYWTAHQRELGILKGVATQLAKEQFEPFFEALGKYQELLAQAEPDPSLVYERAVKAREQFFEDYKKLVADRIILIFDTAEVTSDAVIRFWQETLPKFKEAHSGTLVVIAGREPITAFPPESTNQLQVTGFSTKDVSDYFKRQGIDAPGDIVARVAKLSQRRPILVALAVDWIKFGNAPQDLVAYQPDKFEQAMVERVQQLRSPEDQAILAMAHLYRRFDEQILAYILDQTPEDAANLAGQLSRLSFVVKYRPPVEGKVGSCTLHDEMRDLVRKFVWPMVDPVGEYRLGWNKKIIEYYAKKVEIEHDRMERQNLRLERLFYWLDVDLVAAFEYSSKLFGQAMDRDDADFMEAINAEIGQKGKLLLPSMQREFEFRKAVVLQRRERYPEAIQKMIALLKDPGCESALQASIRVYLVESYTCSGDPQRAIDFGLEGEQWFEDMLTKMSPDDPHRRRVERDFGGLCNRLGHAYRSQNKFSSTVEYCNKALAHLTAIEAYSQIANTKNNLGYVYHRMGQDDRALAECEAALEIRRRLDNPYQLGYSYNVLGTIRLDQARGEEAIKCFEQALQAFRETESERGQALVYVVYGRLRRQWALLIERQPGETPDPEREQYRKARDMLDKAIRVFRRINDRPSLSEALNEKGTLLRQQRRWKDAIKCFEESADLAQQVGNEHRQADNWQDIGILYYLMGQLDQAQDYAERASDIARKIDSHYLYARSQRTMANVMFARGDYDRAFEMAGDALVYFVKLDPQELSYSAARRDIFHDEWMDWVRDEMILRLPTHELARDKCEYLIRRWGQEKSEGQQLADLYPGFITRMHDLAQNYPFLTKKKEV